MLEVLYEDNHIIVVNKPHNVLTQGDKTGEKDLFTQVKEYIKEKYNKPGEVYLGLVHRLDRPAAGVVVFARTSKAAARLSQQFQNKEEIDRVYYAIVRGKPPKVNDILVHYLQKDAEENRVYVVPPTTEGAKQAELEYKVLQTVTTPEEGELSLVQIQLYTGRAHQIRAQMSFIGCPLYGDQKYGQAVNKPGQQLALYAVKLAFTHPTLKDRRVYISYPPEKSPWSLFKIEI